MVSGAFLEALGSPMSFNALTIDQPGKFNADALHGRWRGGAQSFEEADVWLFVGTNPLVSLLGGIPTVNTGWHLNRAQKRGIKLIVIDPRRSKTARQAAIHLQPVPGEDTAIMAGMVRIVLTEGLFDKAFVEENTRNLEALRDHVEPFTPEFVAARADIPAADLIKATRLFATANKAGATAGTGVNMSPRGTVSEYLLACLTTLCGFRRRAGERIPSPGVLVPGGTPRAQARPPFPAWGYPPILRASGLSMTPCGLPTSGAADEMLLEGEGKIRALLCYGGNPMATWPDQIKTEQALKGLDLLVVIDPKLTQTAQIADYVIGPKLAPEIPVVTFDFENIANYISGWGYSEPYGGYTRALLEPPEGSDLLEDWEFFYLLGREMGYSLNVTSGNAMQMLEEGTSLTSTALDMQQAPTTEDLFEILTAGSRIPFSKIRESETGQVFEDPDAVVLPKEPDCEAFLELGDEEMLRQLDEAALGPIEGDNEFAFRLICRRGENTMKSQGRDQVRLVRSRPHNPAYMNPADMEALGIQPGTLVAITSRRATIHAVAEGSADLRRGVISMSHSYGLDIESLAPGDDPGAPQPYSMGKHTGALVGAKLDYVEPHTGLPRMSAIPIDVVIV
jgi:anaerobic selenocysteine-containing dehydrogenase